MAATGASGRGTAHGFVLTGATPLLRMLLRDLWASRSLVAILARKDFHVRYRRAGLGLLWAVALPLSQAIVLGIVFTRFVRVRTDLDYATFVYAGVVVWAFFSTATGQAATGIVDGSDLSTKIYFPRAVLPLVSVASNAYGLLVGMAVLLVTALVRDVPLGVPMLWLVPAAVLAVALAGAFGVVLSALHVYFRDVRYLVQAALLAWFYLTPVVYPLRLAGRWAGWLAANPVTGCVELARAAVGGADDRWLWPAVGWSVGWVAALLVVGVALHRRLDRVFADLL